MIHLSRVGSFNSYHSHLFKTETFRPGDSEPQRDLSKPSMLWANNAVCWSAFTSEAHFLVVLSWQASGFYSICLHPGRKALGASVPSNRDNALHFQGQSRERHKGEAGNEAFLSEWANAVPAVAKTNEVEIDFEQTQNEGPPGLTTHSSSFLRTSTVPLSSADFHCDSKAAGGRHAAGATHHKQNTQRPGSFSLPTLNEGTGGTELQRSEDTNTQTGLKRAEFEIAQCHFGTGLTSQGRGKK